MAFSLSAVELHYQAAPSPILVFLKCGVILLQALSWNSIERFYSEVHSFNQRPEVLRLIAQMRKRGFDKTLRAGQSMYTFIVSRARHHGWLKSYIAFDFFENKMDIQVKFTDERKFSLPKIEFSEQTNDLLKELEALSVEDLRKELRLRTGKNI